MAYAVLLVIPLHMSTMNIKKARPALRNFNPLDVLAKMPTPFIPLILLKMKGGFFNMS
jgi:poly(A) polymerase Pap1